MKLMIVAVFYSCPCVIFGPLSDPKNTLTHSGLSIISQFNFYILGLVCKPQFRHDKNELILVIRSRIVISCRHIR